MSMIFGILPSLRKRWWFRKFFSNEFLESGDYLPLGAYLKAIELSKKHGNIQIRYECEDGTVKSYPGL